MLANIYTILDGLVYLFFCSNEISTVESSYECQTSTKEQHIYRQRFVRIYTKKVHCALTNLPDRTAPTTNHSKTIFQLLLTLHIFIPEWCTIRWSGTGSPLKDFFPPNERFFISHGGSN